ncbi:MAG: beta-ketoacyl synthase N-terminal-like domain-containing protein [Pseudomonadota bacterium]
MRSSPPPEVWITGIGVLSAYGVGAEVLAAGLRAGRGATMPPRAHEAGDLPVPLVAPFPGEVSFPPGFAGDRRAALLLSAAAQLPSLEADGRGCCVSLGTGLSSVTVEELEDDLYPHLVEARFDRRSLAAQLQARAGAPMRHLPARAARALAGGIGAEGPVNTSFSACAAGAQAIAVAMDMLRRGEASRAVAGGYDAMIHPLGLLSFLLLDTLASEACRPFDLDRDGFVLGEGAALFLLETPEAARAAGRGPRARLLGAGTSIDAHAVTAPHPEGDGARLAMLRALEDAAIPAEAVDQVNAHGTGTPVGDRAEALAVHAVLPQETPVCSLKGALGHTIAAAGAMELAATVAAMEAGFAPGTIACRRPDPACPVHVQLDPSEGAPGIVLSNSIGFGGQNASLIVAHPDWQR